MFVVDPLLGVEFDNDGALVASPHRTGVTDDPSGTKKDNGAFLPNGR